jgi:PHD/YefM family antitoxin component YafN of YafNO toxin-antitoxin module
MTTFEYHTYSETRRNLREVLDAAESGRPVGVRRRSRRVALVDAEGFRSALSHSRDIPQPVAVAEAGGWTVLLPGMPIAVDATGFDDAVGKFIQALREYAEDWVDRLHAVPNHSPNWALIQFVSLSTDAQLVAWVRGSSE